MRVVWFIHAEKIFASARLQGYLIHQELVRRGIDSQLLFAPPTRSRDVTWSTPEAHARIVRAVGKDVAVLQKLAGPQAEAMVKQLREAGTRVVYVQCDHEPGNLLPLFCNQVLCTSEVLAAYYRGQNHQDVALVRDPAEQWVARAAIVQRQTVARPIRLCWIGHAANWPTLQQWRAVLAEPAFSNFELITISNHAEASIPWSPEAVRLAADTCDVGIIPVLDGPQADAKSNNRAILFMALGLPVVAGPLPAYRALIRHGKTGFLVEDEVGLRAALHALQDTEVRRRVALAAYDDVAAQYTVSAVTDDWVDHFERVMSDGLTEPSLMSKRERMKLTDQLAIEAFWHLCIEGCSWGRVRRNFYDAATRWWAYPGMWSGAARFVFSKVMTRG